MSKTFDKLNRFVQNPTNLDISRSRFNRPFTHKTTFNAGKLVPIYLDEVLPGDTFQVDISSVVRMLTPAVPVMDNSFLDVFFFFVPNRLCTLNSDDWQKICGENTSGYWAQDEEYTIYNTGNSISYNDLVTVTGGSTTIKAGSAFNYFGLPITTSDHNPTGELGTMTKINMMPFVGYTKIWNEFFRDQNTQAPITIDSTFYKNEYCNYLNDCLPVNKIHDYFTSALPSPQKGDSVLVPLGSLAPVGTPEAYAGVSGFNTSAIKVQTPSGSGTLSGNLSVDSSTSEIEVGSSGIPITFSNLYADLSQATGASVNQLRQAFAIQKMLEKDARGGSRYREILKSHFGVTLPDATAQVPQYLGGKRVALNITQVLQTSETSDSSPLGATGAFSNTGFKDSMFIKSFTEYGYLYGLACVRTSQSYSQGIPKLFTRDRRFDFYYPVFANLGEQPIYTKELYFSDGVKSTEIFGYQERWAEYRFHPNLVTGNLAPNSGDTILSSWTYTNRFTAKPVLNSSFMQQPKSQIDNTLVIETNTQFVADFFFNIICTRPMPLYSIPGLIDHH